MSEQKEFIIEGRAYRQTPRAEFFWQVQEHCGDGSWNSLDTQTEGILDEIFRQNALIAQLETEKEIWKGIAKRYNDSMLATRHELVLTDYQEAYHQLYIGLWDEPSYNPDAEHTVLALALSEQEEKKPEYPEEGVGPMLCDDCGKPEVTYSDSKVVLCIECYNNEEKK